MLKKIISGGQTGVDRGALEAASELGYEIGGWCPPNHEAEDGRIPDYLLLIETPSECSQGALDIPNSLRTEWNVRDSDATLILMPELHYKTDRGTAWTISCCSTLNKPYIICDPFKEQAINKIREWLGQITPNMLNIAGPRESSFPGIESVTKTLIVEVLKSK